MNLKTTLSINLENQIVNNYKIEESKNFVGGEPLSISRLLTHLKDNAHQDYMSITTGPFNGIYPYCSKVVFLYYSDYRYSVDVGGGSLGAFLNYANISSLEFIGKSENRLYLNIKDKEVEFKEFNKDLDKKSLGLFAKRSFIDFTNKGAYVDDYFNVTDHNTFIQNNLRGICFSTNGEFAIESLSAYNQMRQLIIQKKNELTIKKSNKPSCYGCPLGCKFSANKESLKISALPRSLVACGFATNIYSDINTVFGCFNALDYRYNHEFLEGLSPRYFKILEEVKVLIRGVKNETSTIL